MTESDLTDVAIRPASLADPEVLPMVAALQLEYQHRYGSGDETPVDVSQFLPPHGLLLLARHGHRPVAIGAYRRHDDATCELKRMYVPPEHRTRGLGRLLLAHLEEAAVAAGYQRCILETGTRQPEAIALYRSSGYEPIAGFGHYAGLPLSRSFSKDLRGST